MCWILSEVSRAALNTWCQSIKSCWIMVSFSEEKKKGKTWNSLSRLISYGANSWLKEVLIMLHVKRQGKAPQGKATSLRPHVREVQSPRSTTCTGQTAPTAPPQLTEVIHASSRLPQASDRPGSYTQIIISKIILARDCVIWTLFHAPPALNKSCIALVNNLQFSTGERRSISPSQKLLSYHRKR